jgi:hypothetical protein
MLAGFADLEDHYSTRISGCCQKSEPDQVIYTLRRNGSFLEYLLVQEQK